MKVGVDTAASDEMCRTINLMAFDQDMLIQWHIHISEAISSPILQPLFLSAYLVKHSVYTNCYPNSQLKCIIILTGSNSPRGVAIRKVLV
jgi:hypothetical protein